MNKKRQNNGFSYWRIYICIGLISEVAKDMSLNAAKFSQVVNSHVNHNVGVTNLWLPSLFKRVSVQHTKEAKRSCPPLEKHADFISQFLKSACEICANSHRIIRNDARMISLSGNTMSFSRDCMHLCSQGPHLWPFILSQVKGLRDTGAHQTSSTV